MKNCFGDSDNTGGELSCEEKLKKYSQFKCWPSILPLSMFARKVRASESLAVHPELLSADVTGTGHLSAQTHSRTTITSVGKISFYPSVQSHKSFSRLFHRSQPVHMKQRWQTSFSCFRRARQIKFTGGIYFCCITTLNHKEGSGAQALGRLASKATERRKKYIFLWLL